MSDQDRTIPERPECEHVAEIRLRRDYDPAVILSDAVVCAKCETALDDDDDEQQLRKRTW